MGNALRAGIREGYRRINEVYAQYVNNHGQTNSNKLVWLGLEPIDSFKRAYADGTLTAWLDPGPGLELRRVETEVWGLHFIERAFLDGKFPQISDEDYAGYSGLKPLVDVAAFERWLFNTSGALAEAVSAQRKPSHGHVNINQAQAKTGRRRGTTDYPQESELVQLILDEQAKDPEMTLASIVKTNYKFSNNEQVDSVVRRIRNKVKRAREAETGNRKN